MFYDSNNSINSISLPKFLIIISFLFFLSHPFLNVSIAADDQNNQPKEEVKQSYIIKASADEFGGQITPVGETEVLKDSNQVYMINPKPGYEIADVQIDEESIGAVDKYSFENNDSDHSISVTFKRNSRPAGNNLLVYPKAINSNVTTNITAPSTGQQLIQSSGSTNQNASSVTNHTITVTSGLGGGVSPSGTITVPEASNQSFVITPQDGYTISDVLVDGSSVGAVDTYTLANIQTDHSISAVFSSKAIVSTHTIIVITDANGVALPSGAVTVSDGGAQTIVFTPAPHYHVADVLVDGTSVGAVASYTFSNVITNHTIAATFAINTHTVTASVGPHGIIAPLGSVVVNEGSDQSFTITADSSYNVKDVLVNGVSVGALNSYTLNNISTDQTIAATFVATHLVNAQAGANGSIAPSGVIRVSDQANQLFTITPNAGYQIQSFLVDQLPVDVGNNAFTLSNVTSNHDIKVNFMQVGNSNHNFTFDFDAMTTLLKRINWTNSSGVVKTIVWDEQTRFPWNTIYWSPSWVQHFLHSLTGSNFWLQKTGPKYTLANDPNTTIELFHGNLAYTLIGQNSNTVQINVISNNLNQSNTQAGPHDLQIEDTLRFVGDAIYITLKITNNGDQKMTSLQVPLYFGSLMIGNFNDLRKIKDCQPFNADGFCNNPDDGPKLGRLRPNEGGLIDPLFENPAGSSFDMYPSTNTFSPVAALWGAAKFGSGDSLIDGQSEVTIGAQFLTNVQLPTTVAFAEIPADQHSPEIDAKIITSLDVAESKTFVIAFKIVDGAGGIDAAGQAVWQEALKPYKDWFNFEYGTFNSQTQNFEPIPQYCPNSPLTTFVGSNVGPPRYDRNQQRYAPNSTLRNIFSTDTKRTILQQLGIQHFGVWQTAISGNLIGGNEFDPNIALIDSNLDAGPDPSKINDFTDAYAQNNVDVFWFARPCRYIEGANISYTGTQAMITPGTWNGNVDLSVPANRDRYFNDMKSFVNRGVKGFYLDEGNMCPGYEDFIRYIKGQFKSQNNIDIFLAQEGAVDRAALLSPEIPILKLPTYNLNSSALLFYLVPYATYYQGGIDNPLNDDETNDVLNKGYQLVDGLPYNVTSHLCKLLKQSHNNQLLRWQNYGQQAGCSAPAPVSEVCLNYPDIYYIPTITVGPGGNVAPSIIAPPGVLEGSHLSLNITAEPGYHIKNILITNDGIGNQMATPGNVTSLIWTTPDIVGAPNCNPNLSPNCNPDINVTFEQN